MREMRVLRANRRMLAVAAVSLSACALVAHGETGGVTVAREGEALAKIVIPKDASGAVQFAAAELKLYLSRVSGAAFEITSTDPDSPPRIYLGDGEAARAAGLDVASLKRDGFFRGLVGRDFYILGRDDPDPRYWGRPPPLQAEHGTLFGVYDFLEDVCGVRWFMAGSLGEVVPKREEVTVPPGVIREEPAFQARKFNQLNTFHYHYRDAGAWCKDRAERYLWALRLRWETQKIVAGCHSATYLKFGERFGEEHPEWFSLRADGTRAIKTGYGPHLCWSQPEVIDAFVKDARAYFTGQPPESRGLKEWPFFFSATEFMVDPSDGYTKCRCDRCQTTLEKYPGQNYSEIMFAAVAKVADSIKDLEGKYITTLAYSTKVLPPKSVTLPDNVRIRLCTRGSNLTFRADTRTAQLDLLKAWSERIKGDLVLWTYPNRGFYGRAPLAGAVETMPHAISAFLKEARPYIRGVFFENEAQTDTYRMLDCYVMMRLAWDPGQDVDALLDDYFTNFYGPAAKPIWEMYARLEALWKRSLAFYPDSDSEAVQAYLRARPDTYGQASTIDLWEKVYTEAEVVGLGALLAEAEALTDGTDAPAARVALLRTWLYDTLVRYRANFVREFGSLRNPETICFTSPLPPEADGFLASQAWDRAEWQRLAAQKGEDEMHVIGRIKTLWQGDTFFLYADLEDPHIERSGSAAERVEDDPELWKDNDIEIFFARPNENDRLYQMLINDRGVHADHERRGGIFDWDWDGFTGVRARKGERGWIVEAVVSLEALGIEAPTTGPACRFNVLRYRVIRDQEPEVYAWAPDAMGGSAAPHLYGSLRFSAEPPPRYGPNLVVNASFELSGKGNRPLAEWPVHADKDLEPPAISRDTVIRWDGGAALRIANRDVGSAQVQQYVIGLKPATRYHVRFRVRSEGIECDSVEMTNGAFFNFQGPIFNDRAPWPALRGTSGWRTMLFHSSTAAEFEPGKRGVIRLQLSNASGTVWFDDVSVREELPAED